MKRLLFTCQHRDKWMVSDEYISNKNEKMMSEFCLSPLSAWSLEALTPPLPLQVRPQRRAQAAPRGHNKRTEGRHSPSSSSLGIFLGVGWVGRARLGHSLNPAGNAQRQWGNGRAPGEKNPLKHEVDFEVSVYCILFRFPKQTGTRRHWFQYRFKHMQHWCPICTLFFFLRLPKDLYIESVQELTHTCTDSSWHQSWGKKKTTGILLEKPNFSTASAARKSPPAVLNCFPTSKLTVLFFFFLQFGAEQAVVHQVVVSEMVQNSPRFTVLETKPIFPLKTMPDADEVSHGDADVQNRKTEKT